MAKHTNPRRIPRTEADVKQARQEGRVDGMIFMLYVMLFILKDKHDAPSEDIQQLGREVDEYCEAINRGEIKLRDVKTALKEEFNMTVRV